MSFEERIATRASLEIRDGQVVNFGIGIPNLISRFLTKDKNVMIHSENGVLGIGAPSRRGCENRNLIDAGGTYMTLTAGASFFDSSISFALVRGGRAIGCRQCGGAIFHLCHAAHAGKVHHRPDVVDL